MTDERIDRIARVCHEANRAWCHLNGDHSQVEWSLAPEWQRQSARAGVAAAIGNPEQTPEQQHNEWMRHKEADGWTYGAVKDAEKKEHPQMVPYETLPPSQKAKDHLFLGIVRALDLVAP
jgi:hypothetical protein